ncbi:MAG: hypothetical protein ACR2QO_24260, partial [Acidimicrobiales bacterium]
PSISDDGNEVAFESAATDLVPADTNTSTDVFVWTAGGSIERASVATGGAEADADSTEPLVSGDGAVVAFVSEATNLGEPNSDRKLFVRSAGVTSFVTDPINTLDDISYDGQTLAIKRVTLQTGTCGFPPVPCTFERVQPDFVDDAGTSLMVDSSSYELAGSGFQDLQPTMSADGTTGVLIFKQAFQPHRTIFVTLDGTTPSLDLGSIGRTRVEPIETFDLSGDGDIIVYETLSERRFEVRRLLEPRIDSITPSGPVVPGASVPVTIAGDNFDDTLRVAGAESLVFDNVVVADPTSATATLMVPGGIAPGDYTVLSALGPNELVAIGTCTDCLTVAAP